ncbi:hypothetical protein RJ640_015680 [Escallonia rubra]|uniref:GAG-pre-integrase domain-containing protein n=1 Tax=Escallonia rubra TaxID=112253 RepID=A0AA88QM40_9ASTE|nr:hypothetical protein RJ640_015680 [Escallonia rubra]
MAEEGKGKIEKFNGMNFQWWKMQVEDYLYQKDLYLPLVGEKPEAMNASETLTLNDVVSSVMNDEMWRKTIGDGISSSTDLSVESRGYFVAFGEKQWKVIKGSMVVARGERVGTLYTLSGTDNHSISLAFTENQRTTLWHHKLGHLSESGMRILHSKNALTWMKNIQLDFWEGYVYGKQKRVNFRRDGKEKKIERLELVHKDVCGPTTVKSLGGNFYFVSFIDDASRKTWIYAITEKSNIYHTFKKWKALVENETWNKIKCLKSNNGEDGQVPRTENPEVLDETIDTEIGAGDQQQVPETLNLRRSSRDISSKELVRGLPKIKFEKDKVCDACQMEESINVTFDETNPFLRRTNIVNVDDMDNDLRTFDRSETLQDNSKEIDLGEQQSSSQGGDKEASNDASNSDNSQALPKYWTYKKDHPSNQILAKYTKELLKRFDMEESNAFDTPMRSSLKLDEDEKGKDVDIKHYRGLWFPRNTSYFDLVGYSDAEYAGCKTKRKSTSGGFQFLGHSLVSCSSKKRNSVALSTTEAEYVAVGACCAQILWMKQTLLDFGLKYDHIPILCDNSSAIDLSKNPIQHSRTKHIEIKHYFIRDHVHKGDIVLDFVETNHQLVNIFTKPLDSKRVSALRRELGMSSPM